MLTAEKQQALMILQVLQGLGATIDEIYGLTKIVDLRRLGNSKQWPPKDQESFARLPMQPPSQVQNRNGDNNTKSLSMVDRDQGRRKNSTSIMLCLLRRIVILSSAIVSSVM